MIWSKKTITRYCPFNASLFSCRLGRVQPGEEAGWGEETAGRVPAQVGDREEEQEGDSLIDLLFDLLIDCWSDLLIDCWTDLLIYYSFMDVLIEIY